MRRVLLAGALLGLASCHDFAAELAACIADGGCVNSTDTIPTSATLVIDIDAMVLPTFGDFGGYGVGTPSTPKVWPIRNKGQQASGPLQVALGGANSASFAITDDTCTGKSLVYNETCAVTVVFTPADTVIANADLNVSAMPGGLVTAPLKGTGQDPAQLDFNPFTNDYGQWEVGKSSAPVTFTLSNLGSVTATGLQVRAEDSDAGVFVIDNNGCNSTLGGGMRCAVVAHFTPRDVLPYSGRVLATANGGLMASATLSGLGIAPPQAQLVALTLSVSFMNWNVGATSTAQQIIIKNAGGQPTSTLATNLSGGNPGDFAITVDGCNGQTLAPMATCTLQVTFTPSAAGGRSASISVSAVNGGAATVPLSGSGDSPASLTFSPASWDFGGFAFGAPVPDQTFLLTNTGTLTAVNLTTGLSDLDGGTFLITANNCAAQLGNGASCMITTRFTPSPNPSTTVLYAGANLNASATGTTATAPLAGRTLPASTFTIMPTSHDFGQTVNGKPTLPATFTVQNIGAVNTGALILQQIGANSPHFTLTSTGSPTSCGGRVLLPNDTCTFTVSFSPQLGTLGDLQVSEQVSASPGGINSVNVRGRSITEAQLSIVPRDVVFPDTDAGATAAVTFDIQNLGQNASGPVAFGVYSFDAGWDAGVFSIGPGTCAGNIIGGDGGCSQTVLFAPTGYGYQLGAVFAYANDGGFPSFPVVMRSDGGLFRPDGGALPPDRGIEAWTRLQGLGHGTFTLTIAVDGGGGSIGYGDAGAICYPPGCTVTVEGGQPLSLVPAARPGWFFQLWGGGTCSGSDAGGCVPPMRSNTTVRADFDHYNFVFITSRTYDGNDILSCSTIARDAGLPSGNWQQMRTYTATLLDGGMSPYPHTGFLGGAGWVRTDGKPYVSDFTISTSGSPIPYYFPLQCDEFGNCLDPRTNDGGEVFWTGEVIATSGTNSFTADLDCSTWTSASSFQSGVVGSAFGVAHQGFSYEVAGVQTTPPCGRLRRVVCIEDDKVYAYTSSNRFAPPLPSNARRAFMSAASLAANRDAGSANTVCRDEAADAGFPNAASFVALRSSSTAPASSLVRLDAGDWYRPDGFRAMTVEAMKSAGPAVLEAPLIMDALGRVRVTRASQPQVWTGAPLDGGGTGRASALTDTCNDWTSSTGSSATVGQPEMINGQFWGDQLSTSCGTLRPVYCFEN